MLTYYLQIIIITFAVIVHKLCICGTMKKTSFEDIKRLFNEKQWKQFEIFLQLKSAEPRIIELYKIINAGNSRDEFQMKGSADKNNSAIRNLISTFLNYIDEFFIFKQLESEPEVKNILLLRALKDSQTEQRFIQKLKALKKDSLIQNNYKELFGIYSEEYSSEPDNKFHLYNESLQKKSDFADLHYFNEKLLIFQLMLSKQILNKEDLNYKWDMWEQIKQYININEEKVKNNHPEIYLKYLTLLMVMNKTDESLTLQTEEYLEQAEKILPKKRITDYYSDYYNYLTIRINEGEHKLRKKQLELIKFLDKKDLLLDSEGTGITYYNFKQISDTCLFMKELEWLEYFLSKYRSLLKTKEPDNLINLVFAKIFLMKNDFRTAKEYIKKVSRKDFIHYIDSQITLAKAEFESGFYHEALQIADSSDKYLRSHKEIPAYQQNNTSLFFFYLKKIIKINDINNSDIKHTEAELLYGKLIDESSPVHSRKWLEGCLERYK